MDLQFDEILEFDEEKYQDNIARHTFAEPDEKDGRGGE